MAEQLADGLQVVTAPNAGPMTFTGTRSYLLGDTEVALIDPGPDDPAHFAALGRALAGRRLSHVIVTHSHLDHSPLAKRMSRAFDAPVYGFGESHAGRSELMNGLAAQGGLDGGEGIDKAFKPDITVKDSDVITGQGWQLCAVHTPGHLSNHLCYAWHDYLFSGDHVMGWATTLVSPPDGDMAQFMASLRNLQNRPEKIYFPGHGAPIDNPQEMLTHQLDHRQKRENQILEAVFDGNHTIDSITAKIYADIDKRLLPAASRNVLAHIIGLVGQGTVLPVGRLRRDGQFQLV